MSFLTVVKEHKSFCYAKSCFWTSSAATFIWELLRDAGAQAPCSITHRHRALCEQVLHFSLSSPSAITTSTVLRSHSASYMPVVTQTYQTCFLFSWIYTCHWTLSRVCIMCGYVYVCALRYMSVCMCMQIYPSVYKCLQVYTSVCKCMQVYASVCICMQACPNYAVYVEIRGQSGTSTLFGMRSFCCFPLPMAS